MIPLKHHLEAVILKRRLELLDLCDAFIMRDLSLADSQSPQIEQVFDQFSDVREIDDLIASLEKVHDIKRARKTRREH